ncbi:sugar phosphate isomerase/epimerase family protein [Zunongwangia sp. H14]|uniref:sugar phosphate isomerase/epimerase family protein n=1 Tax=Zunongwangia sp. H14 TaxID=3240792 RepID=UPI0035675C57
MISRKKFLVQSAAFTAGAILLPSFTLAPSAAKVKKFGVQLYTFRDALDTDARGTLEKIAAMGIKEIESARSQKGNYYGMGPQKMQAACKELGMKLVSGHVHLDDQWEDTMQQAVESGQEYLICSTMPSEGQTVENYKKVANMFNEAGKACKERNLKFGYHNHEYEFETKDGQVLYDVLLENTDPDLVHMELDLGWVVATGNDPVDYFQKFPGRFPLWHLKDMNITEKESTEFGNGDLDINRILENQKKSGVKHIFIEQEEYTNNPFESMEENMAYLRDI